MVNSEADWRDVVVDTKLDVYGLTYGLYVGQYNNRTKKFDICGDDLGYGPENFSVLEMIEYKGNK